MAKVEVIMPQMGESITEGTIVKWHKKAGEAVAKDEVLLEISTDKVDSEIPSPVSGVLTQIVVEEQATVPVRTVIAYIDGSPDVRSVPSGPPAVPETSGVAAPAGPSVLPVPDKPQGGRFYSPLVLNIAREEAIAMQELERIPGTGEGGRVTKKDLLAYVQARKSGGTPVPGEAPPPPAMTIPASVGKPVDVPELRAKYPSPAHEIIQMSNVMQKMAQHMVHSQHTSPHVNAVHEVDLTPVVNHRAANSEAFGRKEGFKLTFTPYVAHAVVKALKKYPLVNSSLEGDKIIRKNFINLGIAVASEHGLLVPVVKHAEEKSFLGIARAINDLAVRTRAKKLAPDDIQGGTFTISNYGVFGTMIGTPIISQPQVAILGTGAIEKRVAVINDAIAIRSMAYFTLAFDHRIIDGALGGMFLEEIVKSLEEFDTSIKF
jgi:2-oxoglutarate dehydrogenase E2 component (dihydrolipoamide succinyltransferase)